MSKLSIDLFFDEEGKHPVPLLTLFPLAEAARRVLVDLRELAPAVEVFRVTFDRLDKGSEPGPIITIYYADPFGAKCWYGTDYRCIGHGSPTPNATEIVDHLMGSLPGFIRQHLDKGEKKLAAVQQQFKALKARRPRA